MADYVLYWRRSSAERCEPGESIRCPGSNQFGKVEPGDTVWLISSDENGLYLFGRVPVGEVIDRKEAEQRFNDLWDADWFVVPEPDACYARSPVDFEELVPKLEFDGRVRTVTGTPSHHHFRSMRKLTSASSDFLEAAWANCTSRSL